MRQLRVTAVQAAPLPIGSPAEALDALEAQARPLVDADVEHQLLVFPEMHLCGVGGLEGEARTAAFRDASEPLDGPLVTGLREVARRLGVWLLPGSLCERGEDGELFNTAVLLSPDGELVASYRKIFPWRPYEPFTPGDRFVVADLPGVGRVGLSICYDSWFPEVARHLAWAGAEVVLNVVQTTTPDRAQELVLARSTSIVNQVFTVSVNCAGPLGRGLSLVVDPEGEVLAETTDAEPGVLVVDLDLDHVTRVHEVGTAGTNRVWSQFLPDDAPLALPLYSGRIDPATWEPAASATVDGTRSRPTHLEEIQQ
ncbi:carbon-nitrogen hydrolase family protein [Nocardioides sp. GY 10127]|uniref:carbon-nitrogen hydrolase family protein n=1 Tax=Nocardioides sp. GY 10127 TaxID=2569762 RepID=UPI001F106B4F|nr:carbon-nitrogen hydrolase family protein [Nocardioides sp. GY 10127]